MHFAVFIVPIQGEADVFATSPIFGDLVRLFEYTDQMVDVFFPYIFDSEVVNSKCEGNVVGVMFPQTRDDLALCVSMLA